MSSRKSRNCEKLWSSWLDSIPFFFFLRESTTDIDIWPPSHFGAFKDEWFRSWLWDPYKNKKSQKVGEFRTVVLEHCSTVFVAHMDLHFPSWENWSSKYSKALNSGIRRVLFHWAPNMDFPSERGKALGHLPNVPNVPCGGMEKPDPCQSNPNVWVGKNLIGILILCLLPLLKIFYSLSRRENF